MQINPKGIENMLVIVVLKTKKKPTQIKILNSNFKIIYNYKFL